MARRQKPGWYPDPENPGREREWDGDAWGESRMAPPGKTKKKRGGSLILKVALGIILAIVLLIGGCVALLGAGVDQAQKDSDKTAITAQEYSATKTGDLRKDVEKRLGEPSSRDEFSSEVEGLDEPVGSKCVYYNREGEFASIFQFCFDVNTDKLESKSSF